MAFSLRLFRIGAAFAILQIVCRLSAAVTAGTTGTLSGTVSDSVTHQALAQATVTIASPSQSAKAITDRSGHFAFLALAPDTYTVTVTLAGYQSTSASGETVIADQTRTLNVPAPKALQTIGKVTSRAPPIWSSRELRPTSIPSTPSRKIKARRSAAEEI